MNWYVVKIVFKIVSVKEVNQTQFDEQLKLIEAANEEEALLKSRVYGLTEEATSLADSSQLCKWEFVNIAELNLVPSFTDGTELYSIVHETNEAQNYINFVHYKAAALQLRFA
jgi:hypothetical protein